MILRQIENTLFSELNQDTVLTMTGARQVGKTTLLLKIRDHLRHRDERVEFLTLEDKYVLSDLNEHPRNLFHYIDMNVPKSKKIYVLIDEIQYLDDPSNFLKFLYDLHRETIKLIVTGSSAFYIDRKYKDSLAGRKKIVRINPLSFSEFLAAKGDKILADKLASFSIVKNIADMNRNRALLKPDMVKIMQHFREYFLYGGYPRVVLEDRSEEKMAHLKELCWSFLKKDILEANVRNEQKFYDLLRILANQCGQLLNMNELSNTLGISRDAIENYVYILEKGYIIRLMRPFHTNLRKELTKMPKAYFLDSGLRNTVMKNFQDIENRTDSGGALENCLFISLFNHLNIEDLKFWRTKDGNEVDFVVNERIAFETKFNKNTFRPRQYASFAAAYPDIPLYGVSYSKNYAEETDLTVYDFLA